MFAFKHPLVYECDKMVHVHIAGFSTVLLQGLFGEGGGLGSSGTPLRLRLKDEYKNGRGCRKISRYSGGSRHFLGSLKPGNYGHGPIIALFLNLKYAGFATELASQHIQDTCLPPPPPPPTPFSCRARNRQPPPPPPPLPPAFRITAPLPPLFVSGLTLSTPLAEILDTPLICEPDVIATRVLDVAVHMCARYDAFLNLFCIFIINAHLDPCNRTCYTTAGLPIFNASYTTHLLYGIMYIVGSCFNFVFSSLNPTSIKTHYGFLLI